MPGIRRLDDGGFIRAFQVIDRVIQNNQPLFVLMWVGSVLSLIAATVLGLATLSGADRLLIIVAAAVYFLCVQLPTVTINIPLNNMLQKLEPDSMDETTRKRSREAFESRWNRWNIMRTACAMPRIHRLDAAPRESVIASRRRRRLTCAAVGTRPSPRRARAIRACPAACSAF